MRSNLKELASLARFSKRKPDKDGVLYFREKQDGLFKRGDVFVERWCRLVGNLFFYFKSSEPTSEPAGVFLLERFSIEYYVDPDMSSSFRLLFDAECDKPYVIAARSDAERDSWMQALQGASIERLRLQMETLRETIRKKTGHDPMENAEQSSAASEGPSLSSSTGQTRSKFHVGLACCNLPNDSLGRSPNPLVIVSQLTPPQYQWSKCDQTEVVEKSNNPRFAKTVCVFESKDEDTKLKFSLFDMKERMTTTMVPIGDALIPQEQFLTERSLVLPLFNSTGNSVGCIAIELIRSSENEAKLSYAEVEQFLFVNSLCANFQFDAIRGLLHVTELMAESRICFLIPKLLLNVWINEEQRKIEDIENLSTFPKELEMVRQEVINLKSRLIEAYTQSSLYLDEHEGHFLKPSKDKGSKELEFVPVNLHFQRMCVADNHPHEYVYDVITVGAFTAYAQSYKQGGLYALLAKLEESRQSLPHRKFKSFDHECVLGVLENLHSLREEIRRQCDHLCYCANQGAGKMLKESSDLLADKSRQLFEVGELSVVCDLVTSVDKMVAGDLDASKQEHATSSDVEGPAQWRWSGTKFVKTPTVEPWDVTRVNTEAALISLLAKVEEVIDVQSGEQKVAETFWLSLISPLVINYKNNVDLVTHRACDALTLYSLMEDVTTAAVAQGIQYRRDVIFSQGLTALVSGFYSVIWSNIDNLSFLHQLVSIGLLVQYESLLSCHGDEMAMLEDTMIAMQDLDSVQFKFEESNREDFDQAFDPPKITGGRLRYTVHLPVPPHIFARLPKELKRGHGIHVFHTMFSIGINEQATLAETFGDVKLQEMINYKSLHKLQNYFINFEEVLSLSEDDRRCVNDLMKELNMAVFAKRSKNTEILKIAEELTRKMNGIRFTMCKSAKDRTSMAVTLEQANILKQRHNLADFEQALSSMRSVGTRRENVAKNTNSRKYAFTSMQLLTFPKQYRPPSGTYGLGET